MMSHHSFLQWYADRTGGGIPEITIWNAPLWIYKGVMLLWAVWLAASLVYWLRWGWAAFRKRGTYYPPKPRGGPKRSVASARGPSAGADAGAKGSPGQSADSERARVP